MDEDRTYIVRQTEEDENEKYRQNGGSDLSPGMEYRGGDYYDFIAQSSSLRPISVTEGQGIEGKTSIGKFLWWVRTVLQFLSIIILSVRTDRLSECVYLSCHWRHYGGMLVFSLLSWSPQVLNSLGVVSISVSPGTAYSVCVFGLFYYILSISLYFLVLAPYMRRRWGTALTLRVWEYYVSVAWQVQTLGFWALTITPVPYQYQLESIPHWLTTSLGIALVIFGIGSKMGAIYGTGYNTYYWYDMVTDIPNAHFIEIGIYKCSGSPTYTLGRGTSFGTALHYRSVPLLLAAVGDLLLINLFNRFVEQPFVRRKYLSESSTRAE